MTKPFIGPFGLSLRDSILLSTIVASMALSACMTSQEKKQREEAFERLKAAQVARIEQAHKEEEEKKAAEKAALMDWVKKNEPYVRGLCASDPGAEHQYAWDNFHIAVSTDSQHAAEAAKARLPIIPCEELRVQKPAEFDADAFMAQVIAEQVKRDEWLASAVGKEYQRHLCSLSGDERQQALAAAAQLHGIIPRENVTDENKARQHGFAVLDCAQEKTSVVGYTWSNVAALI
jgi:hypothetical protein